MGPAPGHLCGFQYLTQSFQTVWSLGMCGRKGILSTSLKVLPDMDGFSGDGNGLGKHRTEVYVWGVLSS